MDFLEKLNFLMERGGYNKSSLSKGSGIPYTTIDNWYKRGYDNLQLPTVKKLCSFFGTSLDFWLKEEITDPDYGKATGFDITYVEMEHIKKYRNLDDSGRQRIDYELDTETERVEEIRRQKEYIESLRSEVSAETFPTRIWAYYGKIASAGTSVEFVDMVAGTKEYPVTEENENADYTIGVNGDSMEPLYNDGDVVFVKHTIHLHIGDIGIFQKDNNIYIKQVGEGCLVSLNPNYDPIKINDGIRVWGKVLGKAAEPNWTRFTHLQNNIY